MRVALILTVCLLLAGAALAQRFGGLRFEGQYDGGPETTFSAKGGISFHSPRIYRFATVSPGIRICVPKRARQRLVDAGLARCR